MPTVPETFAPSVSQSETPLSPAGGPWVSPMRNRAPQLLEQTGETLIQAGDTAARLGNTIGDRVQATMDEALTKSAETKFLQSALPLVDQYHTTEGLNAVTQFDPTAQAISKARQDARATLTDPIQQHMFDQVTNDHLMTFGQQMHTHEQVQRVQYGKQQGNDRADSMNGLARTAYLGGDMAGYMKYSQQADAETLGVAQLSGAAPDSDVAQAMLRAKRSDLARGVVSGLLDRHAYNEAGDYFSNVQGALDMRTSEMLGSAIKSVTQQEETVTNGQKAILAAKGKIGGPGVLQPPVPGGTITTTQGVDGIDIHAAPGTPVHAPASGTVTKVWNDDKDGGGLTVQMQMPGGYMAEFNHLSAANYQAGQKITVGQVLGQTGKDDGGQGVMHYAMTGPDGSYIDPRQASGSPMDPKNFNSPQDEESAVKWLNANVSDPEEQRMAERYVRGIASMNRQIANQEHNAALKQATDWWFEHGQSIADLPSDVRMQLTPEDLDSFNQQAKAKNDVDLLANWIQHPEQQTVDNVKRAYAQGQLSDGGYLTALRGAMSLQADPGNADPQKVQAVSLDNKQLDATLLQNGFPNLIGEGADKDTKAQKIKLVNDIRNEIDTAQTMTGRKLGRDDVQKIIDQTISDSAYIDKSHFFGSPTPQAQRLYFMSPQELAGAYEVVGGQKVYLRDIPATERQSIIAALYRHRMPVSEQTIANLWVKNGRPGAAQK